MNFLLKVTDYTKPVESFLDRLTFGGFMLLLGMVVVFSVLIIIWGSLAIFKLYFSKYEAKPKEEVVSPAQEPAQPVSNDAEIVAVIAAAIAAAEAESGGMKFRVVSFRRK
ncbi:MAG: OadG family protein [Clostridia bacterium]|nr:OadG family protein [Clostridia bacterium]